MAAIPKSWETLNSLTSWETLNDFWLAILFQK